MRWPDRRLGDLVTLQRGHDLPEYRRQPGPVPVIGSAGPNGFHNETKQRGPGVTVGRSGASIGSVTYVNQDYWPHNTCLYVTDFKGNHPRFVAYLLSTLNLGQLNSGAAQPSLNRNFVYGLAIRFPEPATQKRIADTLSAYDDLIENNQKRIKLLERAARELYREWFVRLRFPGHEHTTNVNGVPEGWVWKKISDVCNTVGGGTPSTKITSYWDGDVTWIVPTDVTKNDCLVLLDSTRKITEKGLHESSAKMVPAETILMTSRASVGFFALIDREVCTNQGFINVIPYDEQMRMYVLFNLMSRVAEIRSNAKGSTYPEISKGRFRDLDVVVPAKNLVVEFAKITSDIIRQVRCLKHSTLALSQARDLLLPRLMSEEVTV